MKLFIIVAISVLFAAGTVLLQNTEIAFQSISVVIYYLLSVSASYIIFSKIGFKLPHILIFCILSAIISIITVRIFTPHLVLGSMFTRVNNVQEVDKYLWVNYNGRLFFDSLSLSQEQKEKQVNQLWTSAGKSLSPEELRISIENISGIKTTKYTRLPFVYFDFGFRPTGFLFSTSKQLQNDPVE